MEPTDKTQYIEFTLTLPFYDLVYNSWCASWDKQYLDGHEIMAIADWLGIALDTHALLHKYVNVQAGTGDVYVFFNPQNPQIFLFFDLFNDVTDQCGMIELGLRCPRDRREEALRLMDPLFFKGGPRSALSMDWSNESLLRKVEDPSFYLKNRVLHRFPLSINRNMRFDNFTIIPNFNTKSTGLFLSTPQGIDTCEKALDVVFEKDYKDYVLTYGNGILGGSWVRIYLPEKILGILEAWKKRIDEYWFWGDDAALITKAQALQSIIVGDTCGGDEIIFHNNEYIVLPRHFDTSVKIGKTLGEAIAWLCDSGTLTEAFNERKFEPFDPAIT